MEREAADTSEVKAECRSDDDTADDDALLLSDGSDGTGDDAPIVNPK